MGAMYVALLLTDWYDSALSTTFVVITEYRRNVLRTTSQSGSPDQDVYIGRSETAMWIRVVSSWVCILLYLWSLLAPVLLPDRFGDI